MKTVRFKSDELLEAIRYFEIDENERGMLEDENVVMIYIVPYLHDFT